MNRKKERASVREDAAHFASLYPERKRDRRGFLVTSLGAGFALAVQPVSGQTIRTDAFGLEAGEVKVPVKDGEIPAYRALPFRGTNFPTVIVVEEVFGVHEHIKDICRRLAKAAYFAIAPELYSRLGNVTKMTSIDEILRTVDRAPDAQTMSDLDATVVYAKSTGKANTAKLGITGFCRGGRTVWMYAAHNPNLKAAVAWYGPLSDQPSEAMPRNPLDVVPQLKAPVLGLYAGKDQGITQDQVEKMRTAMKASGKKGEIVVYPDADHGFNADYRPGYNKAAAEDGWKRMLAWFKQNGMG
jgi:carboxymethylenebutenolidase